MCRLPRLQRSARHGVSMARSSVLLLKTCRIGYKPGATPRISHCSSNALHINHKRCQPMSMSNLILQLSFFSVQFLSSSSSFLTIRIALRSSCLPLPAAVVLSVHAPLLVLHSHTLKIGLLLVGATIATVRVRMRLVRQRIRLVEAARHRVVVRLGQLHWSRVIGVRLRPPSPQLPPRSLPSDRCGRGRLAPHSTPATSPAAARASLPPTQPPRRRRRC
jgi:hypothetical protein